jgi:UDPglucose 6-dehydrogenase
MKKVGICGVGVVGSEMLNLFPDAVCYDKHRPFYITWRSELSKSDSNKEGINQRETTMDDINTCDVAFICVPTPLGEKGVLDMSIVEEVVKDCTCPLIIVRSTLQPGTADRLMKKYGSKIVVMPEYLGVGVNHPLSNELERQFMVLGGSQKAIREAIELFQTVYNANIKIRQVTALEAEIIKLTENRAIAYKVAQCQELYDVCEKSGADYNTIREAVYGDDPRFTLWWTFVYPDNRGFNSPCIPKDVYGWAAWSTMVGIDPYLTTCLLKYNDKLIKK